MMKKKSGLLLLLGLGLYLIMAMPLSARNSEEAALRAKLGIPEGAKEVLVFAQSSHVDPDWLLTADEYQKLLTDRTFDRALVELDKDPRYVYSVECIFYFKRYWESHAQQRDRLRRYVNEGRIVFTATGVTSPDTLIPEGENLMRDYLFGFEWLKKNGMNTDPKAAYFADTFGQSPTVPNILRELGYKYTASTRIDGSYFTGIDTRPAKDYPLPGSNTELLLKKFQTVDFVWRGTDGSEVLAHLNLSAYGLGDSIDKSGLYLYGLTIGLPARSAKKTNAKIDSYVKLLRPYSKTGYMFCPIGGDFNPPVPNLNKTLDRYNQGRFPATGVYVVLATLEDYMRLVEFHKDQLPTIAMDPNPTFMGFYSSRPELKQRARNLSKSLLLAEGLGMAAIIQNRDQSLYPNLSAAWEISLFSNHHDFITGTAPDRVYKKEQIPVLKAAQAQVDKALEPFKQEFAGVGTILAEKDKAPAGKVNWRQDGPVFKIENRFYAIEIDERKGGCLTRWFDKTQSREILSGPSNDIILYQENGGLWRMGQELNHGMFKEVARASALPALLSAKEENGILEVTATVALEKRQFIRRLYFRADDAKVRMKMEGSLNRKRTATVAFRTTVKPGKFVQELPYGVTERPLKKLYEPTFWPVKNWVDLSDGSGQFGVNAALAAPAVVHADENGLLEMIALRYGRWEKVNGIPLVMSFPRPGNDPDRHEFDYGFWPHGAESWLTRETYDRAEYLLSDDWLREADSHLAQMVRISWETDRSDVVVTSLKRAESGKGMIVRLFRYNPGPVTVHLSVPAKGIKQAFLTDGLERVLKELPVKDDQVEVEMPYALATVLLIF